MIEAADLMHSILQKRPFSDTEWLFEWKLDGFRCLVRKERNRVDLISREGKFFNRSFPDVAKAVAQVEGDFVWDAELAVGGGRGSLDFARLQQRARTVSPRNVPPAARQFPARLFVFDLLMRGAHDMRTQPLDVRKGVLRQTFEDTSTLIYVTHVDTVGNLVFEQVVGHDFEGMVCKRKDSLYVRGRSLNWIKIKNSAYTRQAALGFGRV
ncbi:ATP-dependent DNA ligase [Paraburkholderia caribensis]|uniref:ATP-dependent DNA ligase n=1 Tax=Paraburkholderia caribensis TaxID=75105 RepID=UPI00285F8C1F|nr:DNA ligase [Paraburkholderia caribensis]MDR6381853.1 bifunctional non-homologous end joining protein LigD [Paraburkholderia caribensis]